MNGCRYEGALLSEMWFDNWSSSQFCQHCGHQLAINHTADSNSAIYRGTDRSAYAGKFTFAEKSVVPPPGMGQSTISDCGVITPLQPLGYDPVFNPNIPNMEVLRRWLQSRSIFKFSSTGSFLVHLCQVVI